MNEIIDLNKWLYAWTRARARASVCVILLYDISRYAAQSTSPCFQCLHSAHKIWIIYWQLKLIQFASKVDTKNIFYKLLNLRMQCLSITIFFENLIKIKYSSRWLNFVCKKIIIRRRMSVVCLMNRRTNLIKVDSNYSALLVSWAISRNVEFNWTLAKFLANKNFTNVLHHYYHNRIAANAIPEY